MSTTSSTSSTSEASTLQYGRTVAEQYGIEALPYLRAEQATAKCLGCKRTLPRRKFPTTAAKGETPATARRTRECRACRNLRQGRPSRMAAKASATAKAAAAKGEAKAKATAKREARKAAVQAAKVAQVPASTVQAEQATATA